MDGNYIIPTKHYDPDYLLDVAQDIIFNCGLIVSIDVMCAMERSISHFVNSGDCENMFPDGFLLRKFGNMVVNTYIHLFNLWAKYKFSRKEELILWPGSED